ncbi:murein transglycosylase A [Uliginosibacterium paludis]|uniref:peptidoglycan lytic exotransglycosylase n=1 Tax=Uliginosibacterium paludis TaxID=1615952 RepID=A0ABV2CV95_9RHOO
MPPAASPVDASSCPVTPVCPVKPETPPEAPPAPAYVAAEWEALPQWRSDRIEEAWPGLIASCKAMRAPTIKAAWQEVCDAARALGDKPGAEAMRSFVESRLRPLELNNADGTKEGLITGYYEPLILGSRWKSAKNAVPVHAVPDDLLQLDLGEVYPETKTLRLRGRIEGRKVLPYWSRAQIEAKGDAFPAKVLLWAQDPIDFFFLQVQGSGQVQLSDGSRVRIAYADQNGHPYKSIGRWLIDQGELTLPQASAQGIQKWARENPQRLSELLNVNPSYVFFREEASNGEGPKGSLGVPLTAARAIAVDPRSIPLGVPVFISFTMPDGKPMQRLVMAQDTGGAIRGRVRADFFWGFGAEAGKLAGQMRQQGRIWVLWPKDAPLPVVDGVKPAA